MGAERSRLRAAAAGWIAAMAGLVVAPTGARSADLITAPGQVRFVQTADTSFDRYTEGPSLAWQAWMRAHYTRMLVYAPYFDTRLAWFPDAWVYKDLYALYPDSASALAHPEWILRDGQGNPLYIRFACRGGSCPQYAADVGDPTFRAAWLDEAAALLATGYRGLWIDDINLTLTRVSDGEAHVVAPVDPRTGQAMTEAAWRRYMAEFCEQIRAAFPDREIVHNAIWYLDDEDGAVTREIDSADVVNLERGVNDAGIRGGSGTYGFDSFLAHVDRVHARGRRVVFEARARSAKAREYGLAAYLLVSAGIDGLGNRPSSTPERWWTGYDVDLGPAVGPRYVWSGVVRRDFALGVVLVNPPGSPRQLVTLDGSYTDLGGDERSALVLGPAQGAVLTARSS